MCREQRSAGREQCSADSICCIPALTLRAESSARGHNPTVICEDRSIPAGAAASSWKTWVHGLASPRPVPGSRNRAHTCKGVWWSYGCFY